MPSVAEQAHHSNFQGNVGNDRILDWFHLGHDSSLVDLYNHELFLSGLERTEVGGGEGELLIATRRGQLGQYQSRWSKLEFASCDDISFSLEETYDIVGGVFATRDPDEDDIIHFLQIGASTRGIPRFGWKIRCPEDLLWFKMDPASNVFATLAPQNDWRTAVITLRTMTDGLAHPKARQQVITFGLSFASSEWWGDLFINGSRLAAVFRSTDPDDNNFSVVVWNWTTGEMVLRLENERRKSIQFLDEHRIIVWEDDDNFLDVYDTSRAFEAGCASASRVLRLGLPDAIYFDVMMHSGSHYGSKPTHLEGVIPFFAADSPKIMVINVITDDEPEPEARGTSIVVFIEDILRVSQSLSFVRWEDWCEMTASFNFQCFICQTEDERRCFVAGSRYISPPLDCGLTGFRRLEVYDFNPHYIKFAQSAGLQNVTIMGNGRLKYIKSQIVVPWREDNTVSTRCLVHLTEDHVIVDDANCPSESGARLRALSV